MSVHFHASIIEKRLRNRRVWQTLIHRNGLSWDIKGKHMEGEIKERQPCEEVLYDQNNIENIPIL